MPKCYAPSHDHLWQDAVHVALLLDVSEFHHVRINHAEHFANGRKHINGIENFWNQAKRWLSRYNGIPRKSFPLFLKEVQFRFNYGSPQQQLKTLRAWCKI